MQDATAVDKQLLEAVSLAAKSSTTTAQLGIGKDIDIMGRVTLPHTIGEAMEALHVSPTISQHSADGQTSLEVAVKGLPSVDSFTIILELTETRSTHSVAPPTTSFCPRPHAQGIIATTI